MPASMKAERIEWLDLSKPISPSEEEAPARGASPCPGCGWPVAPGVEACTHCGRPLAGEPADDILATLDVEPLPRVVEVTPAPDGWFDGARPDLPAIYDLRLQAERLRVTTGFDRLICLDDISVDHYRHQLDAALRALRDMRGRALLADEVGLGKTIEAGIVMKELIERGLVNSVLIVVPASLTWQWHEEMLSKFHEDFVILESLKQLPPAPPDSQSQHHAETGEGHPELVEGHQVPPRWIISLARARSARWSEHLLAREYDLLIVDEAHKLKNHRTQTYRFVNSVRKRYVLMLTATPVHNDLMELYNLITILRPGHLGTRRAFRRNFMISGPRRRVVTWSARAATGSGVYGYVNKAHPGSLPSYAFSRTFWVETFSHDLSLDELVSPSIVTAEGRDIDQIWRRIVPADIADFAQARDQLAKLLQQGYQVQRARIVRHKKGGIYGFRVELRQRTIDAKSAAGPQSRPDRRIIYSADHAPFDYMRKGRKARQTYREGGDG